MKNRMFGDDQPDQPSPRTTIVGGRPPENSSALPPVPTGLQTLLRLAAIDDRFRMELIARRSAMAAVSGVTLGPSERAILDAAPADQLIAMAGSLPAPPTDRRTFLKEAALAALTVLSGTALQGCQSCASGDDAARVDRSLMQTTGGSPPDLPPPRVDRPEMHTKGGAPPEMPPPRPEHPDMQTDGGIPPEMPPPRPEHPPTPTGGGIEPSLPDAGTSEPVPERPTNSHLTRGIRPHTKDPKSQE